MAQVAVAKPKLSFLSKRKRADDSSVTHLVVEMVLSENYIFLRGECVDGHSNV